MQIIARKDAKAVGLATYYTGKLCKNGHAAYRYVTSGSCSTCINGTPVVPREMSKLPVAEIEARKSEALAARAELEALAMVRSEQRRQLIERFFVCPDLKWQELSGIVIMLTRARYPALQDVDIVPNKSRTDPMGAGNGRYRVNMHPDDYAACMTIEDGYHREIRRAWDAAIFAATPGALNLEGLQAAVTMRGNAWSGQHGNRSRYAEEIKAVVWMIGDWVYLQADLERVISGSLKFATPIA